MDHRKDDPAGDLRQALGALESVLIGAGFSPAFVDGIRGHLVLPPGDSRGVTLARIEPEYNRADDSTHGKDLPRFLPVFERLGLGRLMLAGSHDRATYCILSLLWERYEQDRVIAVLHRENTALSESSPQSKGGKKGRKDAVLKRDRKWEAMRAIWKALPEPMKAKKGPESRKALDKIKRELKAVGITLEKSPICEFLKYQRNDPYADWEPLTVEPEVAAEWAETIKRLATQTPPLKSSGKDFPGS